MEQEARPPAPATSRCACPAFMKEILAALTAELRRSPQVNHRSGVSVRYSIGNLETLVGGRRPARRARRRARGRAARRATCPRCWRLVRGRVEFDTIEEGREEEILSRAMRTAELEVFRRRLSGFDFQPLLRRFDDGLRRRDLRPDAGERRSSRSSATCPAWRSCSTGSASRRRVPGVAASALEFALEGLHLSRRLNKDGGDAPGTVRYEGPVSG